MEMPAHPQPELQEQGSVIADRISNR